MAEIATKLDEAMKLDTDALEAAKRCLADAISWGCEPADALGSAIVEYLTATRPVSDEAVEAVPLRDAAQSLLDRMSSTYKARNGRDVGIEADDGEKCWIVHSDDIEALRAALAHTAKVGVKVDWRLITEDDRPPNDVPVLMGCWQRWPTDEWIVEFGLYGSTKGGWIHGRMTHWIAPGDFLPDPPSLQPGAET